jgi:hypothetical protein
VPPRTDPPTSRRAFAILLIAGGFLGGAVCVGLYAALASHHAVEVARAQRYAAQAEHDHAQQRTPEAVEALRTRTPDPGSPPPEVIETERSRVEDWWSAALQTMALEGLARGWAEVRQDELPPDAAAAGLARFRKEVEALPPRIGRELAEQRGRDELVAEGIEAVGVFEYLELLGGNQFGPFPDLVGDGGRFGALFDCSLEGPLLAGREFIAGRFPSNGLEDGTTLRFDAGVTQVYLWTPRGTPPRCLTIEGAGMDATLLRTPAFHDGGRIEQLTIRDCTLMATSVELLDFRSRGSVARLERVRLIGFDVGSGKSCALALDQTALLARDCRFEGGYGRNTELGGKLVDVRTSALLARFERCRFDAIDLNLQSLPGRATVVFSDCVMIDLRDRRDPRTLQHPGVRLVNCSVQMAAPDEQRDWKRDLNEIFPGWESMR